MPVHHGFLMGSELDPQNPNPVILEFDCVMLGIDFDRVRSHGRPPCPAMERSIALKPDNHNPPPRPSSHGLFFNLQHHPWSPNELSSPVAPNSMTGGLPIDRKSTRLNSSHLGISYAVFCL